MVNLNRSRSGQAIITLVMVVAVSLVVGVAVSSRVVTTLRQVSFSEQSAKALAIAEAGAEDALKLIKDQPSLPLDPPHESGDVTVEDGHFNYTISLLGEGSVFDDLSPLEREKAAQINLEGYGGSSINVYWVNSGDTGETGDNRAALEISLIYEDGGEYKLQRNAYDPIQTLDRGLINKFLSPTEGAYKYDEITYQYRVNVTFPAAGAVKLMRLRAIYKGTSFVVVSDGANLIPKQGVLIESTGYYGEIQRKIEVVRTDPALSELFDFVYFSGSSISP